MNAEVVEGDKADDSRYIFPAVAFRSIRSCVFDSEVGVTGSS